MAVGEYLTATTDFLAYALVWNGSIWSLENMQNPSGALDVDPSGVTCLSSSWCVAVGEIDIPGTPIIENWNGTSWSVTPSPTVSDRNGLLSVSCKSTSTCEAIGNQAAGPLAEGWNGTTWKLQSTPAVPGQLYAVRCTSNPFVCEAVGYTQVSGTYQQVPLVEKYAS
jgi:hypothetical protein